MTFPRFLLLATLLFWGWRTDFLLYALVMGALLELRPVLRISWKAEPADFTRIADLCIVFFLGAAVYIFLDSLPRHMGLTLTQWAPIFVFPLALAQSFSPTPPPLLALISIAPRKKKKKSKPTGAAVNLLELYFGLCLFAAGAANLRDGWFFPCAALLIGWRIFHQRPKRHGLVVFIVVFAICAGAAYVGYDKLDKVQQNMRAWVLREDLERRSTNIGAVGEIKLGQSIVLRVKPIKPFPHLVQPLLLREASFSFFDGKTWHAMHSKFTPVQKEDDGTWVLKPKSAAPQQNEIYAYFPWRRGMVPLPLGANRVQNLPARVGAMNNYGMFRVEKTLGLAHFIAFSNPDETLGSPPNAVDRVGKPNLMALMKTLVKELDLSPQRPHQSIKAIVRYFRDNFTYTLNLKRLNTRETPLHDFMTNTRSGHCEYFATAAVMLLRQAGIPARYATGYAVQEYSPEEEVYIARESHAHAWALAYVDGAWKNVDATPGVWVDMDAPAGGFWTTLEDFRSRMAFRFAKWRWLSEKSSLKQSLAWAILPLTLFLLWRIISKRGLRITRKSRAKHHDSPQTAFHLIEERLRRKGHVRAQSTPVGTFARRTGHADLAPIVRLHYQARFDPKGIPPREEQRLKELVNAWLDDNEKHPAS